MKVIAHGGNLNGPNANEENRPSYINNAIKSGYDVEIDVWYVDNKWYLGHDDPRYHISYVTCKKRRCFLLSIARQIV